MENVLFLPRVVNTEATSALCRSQPNGSAYDSRGLFVSSGHSSLSYATHLYKNLSGKAEIAVGGEKKLLSRFELARNQGFQSTCVRFTAKTQE